MAAAEETAPEHATDDDPPDVEAPLDSEREREWIATWDEVLP